MGIYNKVFTNAIMQAMLNIDLSVNQRPSSYQSCQKYSDVGIYTFCTNMGDPICISDKATGVSIFQILIGLRSLRVDLWPFKLQYLEQLVCLRNCQTLNLIKYDLTPAVFWQVSAILNCASYIHYIPKMHLFLE